MEEILSFEDISNYILEILSGQRITNLICTKEPAVFIQPTCTQNLYSKYLEKQKIIQYLSDSHCVYIYNAAEGFFTSFCYVSLHLRQCEYRMRANPREILP